MIGFERHSDDPQLEKTKNVCIFFVSTLYLRKDFLALRPSHISLGPSDSESYRIYLKISEFLRFCLTLLSCVDEFMGLASKLRHLWLGYNLCGCFVSTGKLINPLNAELNPICHLLALLGSRHIFHVRRIRFKLSPMKLYYFLNWSVEERTLFCWLTNHRGQNVSNMSTWKTRRV